MNHRGPPSSSCAADGFSPAFITAAPSFLPRQGALQIPGMSLPTLERPIVAVAATQTSDQDERTFVMASRAKDGAPFTKREVAAVCKSMSNICDNVDTQSLSQFLWDTAHLSHKQWSTTEANSARLCEILGLNQDPNADTLHGLSRQSRGWLKRVVTDGRWDEAAEYAANHRSDGVRPFAVLVTGLNGIRKTTSLYQTWFPELLKEALGDQIDCRFADLPSGCNSFFRQLDHLIATVCNEEFAAIYRLTAANVGSGEIAKEVVQSYSDMKASIFSRYRTLSEMLGIILLRRAQELQLNCLLETSGRDVAMFEYVDRFFPKGYNKLALHFVINDIKFAQESVDQRMKDEISAGIMASQSDSTFEVISANAGGPYGSEILPDVLAESEKVWNSIIVDNESTVGCDWLKATIRIDACVDGPWTARAVKSNGSLGKAYEFRRF